MKRHREDKTLIEEDMSMTTSVTIASTPVMIGTRWVIKFDVKLSVKVELGSTLSIEKEQR